MEDKSLSVSELAEYERMVLLQLSGQSNTIETEWKGGTFSCIIGSVATIFHDASKDESSLVIFNSGLGDSIYHDVVEQLRQDSCNFVLSVYRLRSGRLALSPFNVRALHSVKAKKLLTVGSSRNDAAAGAVESEMSTSGTFLLQDCRLGSTTKIPASKHARNVIVVGRSGSGMSMIGNLILGRYHFSTSDYSVPTTKYAAIGSSAEPLDDGANIQVVDTVAVDVKSRKACGQGSSAPLYDAVSTSHAYPGGIGMIMFVFSGKFEADEVAAFDFVTKVLFPGSEPHVWLIRNKTPFDSDQKAQKDIASLQTKKPQRDIINAITPEHFIHVPVLNPTNEAIVSGKLRALVADNRGVYNPLFAD